MNFRSVFALPLLAIMMIAGSLTAEAQSPVLDRILKNGELRVGMSGTQPPYNMKSRNGELMGFEVDMAKSLAGAMGVELNIVEIPFGDLLSSLDGGDIDVVMSGVTITAERAQSASFVGPYILSGKSILTKSDLLARANSAGELNQPNLTVIALDNSTSAAFVELNLPQAQLVTFKDYDEGVQMIIDGNADAMVADMAICVLSVMRNPSVGLTTLTKPLTIEPIGMAISTGDHQLKNVLETYLEAFNQTGVITALNQQWFENQNWIGALP
jgi:polar amino acid transport system substrate-binding protein